MFSKKTRITDFIKKQGLFIALIVCIAGIAVAAVLSLNAASEQSEGISEERDINVQNQESPTLDEHLGAAPSPSAASKGYSYNTLPTQEMPEVKNTVKQAKQTLIMPVKGEIIKAFSGNKLVYNSTLNMWKTHNGVDIACEEGSAVVSALPGEIKSVISDPQRGVVVTILHTDNQQTIYAGLLSANVEPGDKVNAGQEIGKSGTPVFEQSDGAHLHFEYMADDVFRDPISNIND